MSSSGAATKVDTAVDVRWFGAGRGGDDTAALLQAFSTVMGGGRIRFPGGYTYTLSDQIDLSALTGDLEIIHEMGAVIVQTVDKPAFYAAGTMSSTKTDLAANMTVGVKTCVLVDASSYATGDLIFISSANTLSGTTDKIGYLRRIKAVVTNTLTLDVAAPRTLNTAQLAKVQDVTLVPQITFTGSGQIRHLDSTNTDTLINFILCDTPRFGSIEIGPSGGPGITLSHVWGGSSQAHIHDLRDDGVGFGYGYNIGGGTRNFQITDDGLVERCRHAVTTNVGPSIPNSGFYGEPENNYFGASTADCSNKAIDTHRAGYGNTFKLNNLGGSGGSCQIRADATIILGGNGAGSNSGGINITADVQIPALIANVNISNVSGTGGVGILCDGPAQIKGAVIRGFTSAGIRTNADNCDISDVYVDGITNSAPVAIDLVSSGNVVSGRVTNAAIGLRTGTGKTDNTYTLLKIGANVTTGVVNL